MDNYFNQLNGVDVNAHTEKKGNLTYLSWAWAWQEVKKRFPNANYVVYENADGCIYHTDGRTCWVKTGVTINDIEHIEYLPVMDLKNKSIPLNEVASFDVNKTIQRSLTKACARHGLGLYIYAGEDLPSEPEELPQKVIDEIENCQTIEQLSEYYKSNKDNFGKVQISIFNKAVTAKKAKLSQKDENN